MFTAILVYTSTYVYQEKLKWFMFYKCLLLLSSVPFNKINFCFIAYEAEKATYFKAIKYVNSFWKDTFLASFVS